MQYRKPKVLERDEPKLVRFERSLNKGTVQGFLAAGVQKFKDASLTAASGPTRVEAAYDAILFCALAIFAAQNLRVHSGDGHHRVALEGMAAELQLTESNYDTIELLRDMRNKKYSGFSSANPADVKLAIEMAERILAETEAWFQKEKPDLLK